MKRAAYPVSVHEAGTIAVLLLLSDPGGCEPPESDPPEEPPESDPPEPERESEAEYDSEVEYESEAECEVEYEVEWDEYESEEGGLDD